MFDPGVASENADFAELIDDGGRWRVDLRVHEVEADQWAVTFRDRSEFRGFRVCQVAKQDLVDGSDLRRIGHRLDILPRPKDERCDAVSGTGWIVVEGTEQMILGEIDVDLFAELTKRGFQRGLAGVDPSARQCPLAGVRVQSRTAFGQQECGIVSMTDDDDRDRRVFQAIRRTSSIVETVDITADFQFQRVVEGIGHDGEEDSAIRRDRKRKHARKVCAANNFSGNGNAFGRQAMEMGKIGAWVSTNALNRDQLGELARGVEDLGYDTLWYPESTTYESLAMGSFLLQHTSRLKVASGIANIYARDAYTSVSGHNSLNVLYGDRFCLGLGVSHIPLVSGRRGHEYGKPVATMRAYLEEMESAEVDLAAPNRNLVLAALGPRMLELSRDMTDGALPYCVTPEHTVMAKEILGPDKWLCVEQKICFTEDETVARAAAAKNMARYLAMPNYRDNWLRIGFSESELEGGGNERFLDSMVLWGSEDTIRGGLQAHIDAGATQLVIQPLDPEGKPVPDWNALKTFRPETWT